MATTKNYLAVSVLMLIVALTTTGCPRVDEGTGKVTTLITTDASQLKMTLLRVLATGKVYVNPNDVQSLTVTVTKIDLLRQGDDGDDEADDDEDKGSSGGAVVVFEGAVDVNLLDLEGVSEVLSNAEVPAGSYTKIRLSIENPRLVLVSDPETEITDVHLTANGRLFVNEDFTIEDGDNKLLLLDFGGIHLVGQGNGGYVLTPQLDASLSLVDADVVASGELLTVDNAVDSLTIALPEGSATVDYSTAVIFGLLDTDTPTGTEVDLVVGSSITVTGLLQVDGSIIASSVRVVAPPAP